MSWINRITEDEGVVAVEVTHLGAHITIAREMSVEPGAMKAAMDGLRRYASSWLEDGWQFTTDPTFSTEDDFLRNCTRLTLEVQAWRRPGTWTDVDTAVNRDLDGRWAAL